MTQMIVGSEPSNAIQELTFDEIECVDGALSDLAKGAIYIGVGAAAVAAAPVLGAGAVATFGIALAGRVLVAGGAALVASSR